METHTLIRPPDSDNGMTETSGVELVRRVSPEHLTRLFACLLYERQILFVSKEVDILSDCIQAFAALLYPFSWFVHTTFPGF